VILRWVLIIIVGLIGLTKGPDFIDDKIWVFSNLFIIISITEVFKNNEELIRKEYENIRY
ncbi:hypothetical protein NS112_12455, partial [Mammaliicoccus sciuri]|uniref:hypothetical protein n=1 Tax=Mammaliicoccus sciuri TaxID=1296 RepID=UPI0007DEEBB1